MKFGMEERHFQILDELLIRPLKDHGAIVWIFGSRATGKNRKFSDVDILFELTKELPGGFLFEIQSNMEDSTFPYKVDLVQRSQVAKSYKDRIEAEKVLIE